MATESWLQGATSRVTPRLIGLDRLTPSPNPLRTIALDENLAELAASIANQGVLHPLLVRPVPGDGALVKWQGDTSGARLACT
jgi:hypothetical protein